MTRCQTSRRLALRAFDHIFVALAVLAGAPSALAQAPAAAEPAIADTNPATVDARPTIDDAPPVSPPARNVAAGNPLWLIPLASLSATRERPIFSSSRRPPAASAPPQASTVRIPEKTAEPERAQLALIGTVVGTQDRIAVFLDDSTKTVIRLRVGEDYHGWILRAIAERETTMEKDDQIKTLALPRAVDTAPRAASRRGQ
jgi:hypothetical protein